MLITLEPHGIFCVQMLYTYINPVVCKTVIRLHRASLWPVQLVRLSVRLQLAKTLITLDAHVQSKFYFFFINNASLWKTLQSTLVFLLTHVCVFIYRNVLCL